MFAKQAKTRESKEGDNQPQNDTNITVKNTNGLEAKFLTRKVKKPLNRKPLYPGSQRNKESTETTAENSRNISAEKPKSPEDFKGKQTRINTAASTKSIMSIKGNFVRASRISEVQAAPNSPVGLPTPSPRYIKYII